MKKVYQFLYLLSLLFIIIFVVMISIDYVNYRSYAASAPYYVYILDRGILFALPSILIFVIATIIKKKHN